MALASMIIIRERNAKETVGETSVGERTKETVGEMNVQEIAKEKNIKERNVGEKTKERLGRKTSGKKLVK